MYQRSLFGELKKEEMLEVIRFEIRLSHKQKMNSVLEGLGYQKNPAFKDVFNTEMAKKVVTEYWKKLIKERNLGLFSISLSLKDILRTIYLANRRIKPNRAIYLIGLFMLGKDENGMRELRSIVSKKSHERTWYRIAKDMQVTSEIITKNKLRDWVTQIDRSITKDIYDKKHQEYHDKIQLLNIELEEHTKADYDYQTTVASVISIARRAKSIFESSEPHEKRAFLNYLLQNPTINEKNLEFTMRSPFNLVLNLADNPNWLRRQGSNLRPIA